MVPALPVRHIPEEQRPVTAKMKSLHEDTWVPQYAFGCLRPSPDRQGDADKRSAYAIIQYESEKWQRLFHTDTHSPTHNAQGNSHEPRECMQTSGLTGSSDIAISRKYGSAHPRHHESEDRQTMLTCFRWVSHHLLQANCAGVKYLYETLLFSGLLASLRVSQIPQAVIPYQGSKTALAQRSS